MEEFPTNLRYDSPPSSSSHLSLSDWTPILGEFFGPGGGGAV